MGFFSLVTNRLLEWFNNNSTINEVGFGDANEFDVTTITNFPYVFIIPTSILPSGDTTDFTYQILITDVLEDDDEPIDALDRMGDVVIQFAKDKLTDVEIEPLTGNNEVIYDQRGNRVYGWAFDYTEKISTVERC